MIRADSLTKHLVTVPKIVLLYEPLRHSILTINSLF